MRHIFLIISLLSFGMIANAEDVSLDSLSYAYGDAFMRATMECKGFFSPGLEFNKTNSSEFIRGIEDDLLNLKYTQDSIKNVSFLVGVLQGVSLGDGFDHSSRKEDIPIDCIIAGLNKVVNHELSLPEDYIDILEFMENQPGDVNPLDLPEEDKCDYYIKYGAMLGLAPELQEYIKEETGRNEDETPANYEAFAAGYALMLRTLTFSQIPDSQNNPYYYGVAIGSSMLLEPILANMFTYTPEDEYGNKLIFQLSSEFSVVDFLDGCRAAAGLAERKISIQDSKQILSTLLPNKEQSIEVQEKLCAEPLKIMGKVVFAEDNEPMYDVLVKEKDVNNQTRSDFDGFFSINIEKGAVLEFSYPSCKTIEVEVLNDSSLFIEMEANEELDISLIYCPQPIRVIRPDSLDFFLPESELKKLQKNDESLSGEFIQLKNAQIGRAKYLLNEDINKAKYRLISPMPLDQYAKQYLGVNRNGHVIVLINLVSSRLMPHFKDCMSKSLITVDDGGNSFGRAKVDLTSDEIIMLRMNGI